MCEKATHKVSFCLHGIVPKDLFFRLVIGIGHAFGFRLVIGIGHAFGFRLVIGIGHVFGFRLVIWIGHVFGFCLVFEFHGIIEFDCFVEVDLNLLDTLMSDRIDAEGDTVLIDEGFAAVGNMIKLSDQVTAQTVVVIRL